MPSHLRALNADACHVGAALAVAVALTACDPPAPAALPSASGSTSAPSAAPELPPMKRPAREGVDAALAAVRDLGESRASYVRLRRAIWSAVPLLREQAPKAAEVLVGPATGGDEAGGALSRLDRARTTKDAARAARARKEVESSLLHATLEIGARSATVKSLAIGGSRAAYDAGLAALGAGSSPADDDRDGTADYLGLLDCAERVLRALGGDPTELVRPLRAGVSELESLADRGRRARATGPLGAAIREAGTAKGERIPLPYAPRTPVKDGGPGEPVHALTVPKPRPARAIVDLERAAELGAKLFRDERLSKRRDRSCLTCHDPKLGWADGKERPKSLDPKVTLRHTPSLLYAPLAAALLWDGRTLTPDDQALGVIRAHAELGGDPEALAATLAKTDEGRKGLEAAGGVSGRGVALALAAYEARELVPARAPIDRFARGDDAALGEDALRGLDVFAGKGRCARCHAPPVFGGSRPPDFLTVTFANLGLTRGPGSKELDPDRGRGERTGLAAQEHAMKTPSIRGAAESPPYFHNGAFPTLAAVVDFYDQGGGRGLGLEVTNQDPDVRKLGLEKGEREALLGFLRIALSEPRP